MFSFKIHYFSKYILLLVVCCTLFSCKDHTISHEKEILEEKVQELIDSFKGDVGIYVQHLKTGETLDVHSDSLFPTASLIKVPIMLKLFSKIEAGELDYHDALVYNNKNARSGEDLLASFADSAKISMSKLVQLMIGFSDNTASLWCQDLAGGGSAINQFMTANGFPETKVNSRTPGREKDYEKFGWGQTSPKEMASLMLWIRNRKAISAAASDDMYRVLSNVYWNGEALSEIPPFVQAASKQGAVSHSRSEVVLVNAPSGDYVFCVITKNQADQSWAYENEGYQLIREISKLLWSHFEPNSKWQHASDAKKWAK